MRNMTNKNRMSGEKGFTLIELLTAILILIVGLLAVGTLQITAINTNSSANRESMAMTKASDILEVLISLPSTHTDVSGGAHPLNGPIVDGIYSLRWYVTPGAGSTVDIEVHVKWTDLTNRKRSRVIKYSKAT